MTRETDKGNSAEPIVETVEVPVDLWLRIRGAVFRLGMGRECYTGEPAYYVGPCDKKRVDALIKDVQAIRFNAECTGPSAKRGSVS